MRMIEIKAAERVAIRMGRAALRGGSFLAAGFAFVPPLLVSVANAVASGSEAAPPPTPAAVSVPAPAPGGVAGQALANLPLGSIAPEFRESIWDVVSNHHFHHRGNPDTFPGEGPLYWTLLNEPVLTLGLWNALAASPAELRRTGPNRFEGHDGNGTSATWHFAHRSPDLHVLFCELTYSGPRHRVRLDGRIVLIVNSRVFKDTVGRDWIRHEVEAFVKVDSKGWKAIARVARPIIEALLRDQMEEAGLFVSIMTRLVRERPEWARAAVRRMDGVDAETKRRFDDLTSRYLETGLPGPPVPAGAVAGAGVAPAPAPAPVPVPAPTPSPVPLPAGDR